MIKTKSSKTLDLLSYIILIAVAIIVILPVLWIVMSSFKPGQSLYSESFLPKQLTIEHYIHLATKTDYFLWYGNTLKIATINMILSLIFTTMTAYIFSRYNFKYKKKILMWILIIQMFPSFLALTAIYIILNSMRLLDTHWGLLLVYVCGQIPYNAWLTKGFFDTIPASLDEAARVDGAGHLTIFWKIILPLAKPILVFIALTSFMGPWFDFIFPKVILRSPNKTTLAMGLFEFVTGQSNNSFTLFAAGALLIAVPITILFVILQKHIVKGLSSGAVKG